MLRAIVLTQYQRVTDGQTDRQMDGIAVASTALAKQRTVKTQAYSIIRSANKKKLAIEASVAVPCVSSAIKNNHTAHKNCQQIVFTLRIYYSHNFTGVRQCCQSSFRLLQRVMSQPNQHKLKAF